MVPILSVVTDIHERLLNLKALNKPPIFAHKSALLKQKQFEPGGDSL